ncbi:hypothetical protein J2Z40_002352 [Cytobacillus eiseniae]|uniref:DUF2804 domain-containing protein n=1 Tax=Cytobacillus eiseniae TaxID=762947 RepID=A0ABS4RFV4_9BACI|nr:DUF2804 domain-containing protein [Cytobacillus eiseniae]MBP2241780.1 hypothetical protein [Cytobacillus eiseniae]
MMKQFEITKEGDLLDQKGRVNQAGYAKDLVLRYNREMVKASKWRIKEWDYYLIGNKDFAVSLTVADNSYMGLAGAQFFDFVQQKKLDFSKIIPLTKGKMNLPTHSEKGDIIYQNQKVSIHIQSFDTHKRLYCKIPNFDGSRAFELDVNLFYQNQDSMVIATPFKENEKAFYYNQKVNNLEAAGRLKIGETQYNLDHMMGVLDWGRGVWTYDNTWYWSSASTKLADGSLFGFNLGYGFGDTSKATENMVFYQGKAYKLNDVDFGIPASSYLNTWHFTSSDQAIDLKFEPIYDNRTDLNVGVIRQDAHQVFGLFSGYVVIDQEKKIGVNQLFGFAEKVRFKW